MFYQRLYNSQINARALIGQSAMDYCAVNPWKSRASSELLYKLLYSLKADKPLGMLEEHSPAARDLQILLVFFQLPAWFTCGLLLK